MADADDAPDDRLRRYYAEKLWEMIPAVYRHEDGIADNPNVLRSLVEVLADQAAIVRRSNDRGWEDQFIDLCDDWAVPYLGDLVGTRLVSALDPRGRRVDVAKTIYYRRRAGTLAVLEELIADITGWEGTVVEEFRRLLRHAHGLDPAPAAAGRLSATPAHGLPDLRRPRGAQLTDGPWDEYHHLPDVRRNHGGSDGRFGITKLAFHLYRLLAYEVERVTPHLLAADGGGKQRFTFDPSGRVVPLYQRHSRPDFELDWRAALAWELPAPMRCEVLAHAEYRITEALLLSWQAPPLSLITAAQASALRAVRGVRFSDESRLRIRLDALFPAPNPLPLVALHRILADALVPDCGKAALLPGAASSVRVDVPVVGVLTPIAREVTVAGNLSSGVLDPPDKTLVIDAENGLGYFPAGTLPAGAVASYHYGFSGSVGAGAYERSGRPAVPTSGQHRGGGAIAAPAAAADVLLEITDNATYTSVADLSVQQSLVFQAGNFRRPYLELAGDWSITATRADSVLTLDGLWIGGRGQRKVRLLATPGHGFRAVTLRNLTLDPGGADADHHALGPIVLSIESPIDQLIINASIVGPILVAGAGLVEKLTLRSSIVHATDAAPNDVAISLQHGLLDVRGCTVLGRTNVHRIEASELLATGLITVDDVQSGCVRFSAFPDGSLVPHPYRPQSLVDAPSLFTSRRFGDPGYAQLSDVAPEGIRRGGDDGTEIGAFNTLLNPIKLDSLQAKVSEFLPFGLIALFITET